MTTQTFGMPPAPEETEAHAYAAQLVEQATTGELVVTSESIAHGAGVEHRAVLQLVEKHASALDQFGQTAFEMRSGEIRAQGGTGRPTRVALLNEQQSTLLMTFMRNTEKVIEFKVRLVKAFFDMAKQLTAPASPASMSRMEILQLAMAAEQENQVLRAQAEIDAPKVGYFDTMVADNDYHLLRTVASDLRVGERDLRLALQYTGWIYSDSYRRRNSKGEIVTEYQWSEYADKKDYFHRVMNHNAPLFKGNVAYTLKITTPGAAAISRLVARINARYGSVKDALPTLEQEYAARRTKKDQPAADSAGLW